MLNIRRSPCLFVLQCLNYGFKRVMSNIQKQEVKDVNVVVCDLPDESKMQPYVK